MSYKDEIKEAWLKENGLVTKATAAKMLEVSKSVITRHPELKTTAIEFKIIVNQDLFNALIAYLDQIANNCSSDDERDYYLERKIKLQSEVIDEEEKKEIENYLAYKAGFNGVAGNFYCNWKHQRN